MQLHYFNIQARSEAAYLIALQGQLPVERKGVSSFADSDLKKSAPFGQLPLLETDDSTVLAQSLAICQFLAEKSNLLPSQSSANQGQDSALLNALALSYVLGVDEFRSEAYRAHRPTTAETAEKDKTEWKEGRQAFFLSKFEQVLAHSKSGFLVGNTLSWADICLYDALYEQKFLFASDFAEKYPHLSKLMNQMEELPNLKSYINDPNRLPLYLPKWRN
ncbi:glutathione S-transferase family protein [Naegleria gruberi]|uniref:Glutathione S-transferase family protein n=1 Tax=Naegleria gruberi TaxID=5762 RepID=D2VYR4_NAEGR|nr:glutathione S-transferase family protein [Naegleria gruberi]EFC37958.1 glutathione S-transferase family protein [Naegleria gruberi]|eukprot:XP_002670702.1 glutathione S-transferase family protein [Naegleria gruberi strain NEG-M]